jgi:hypothetical protein
MHLPKKINFNPSKLIFMEPYNQDLLQDAFYYLDNLKFNLTKIKLAYNRDRAIVNHIDNLLKDCELIQLIVQSYDSYNFRLLCNMINNSFADPNSHGVLVFIIKKRFGENYDRGKLNHIKFPA